MEAYGGTCHCTLSQLESVLEISRKLQVKQQQQQQQGYDVGHDAEQPLASKFDHGSALAASILLSANEVRLMVSDQLGLKCSTLNNAVVAWKNSDSLPLRQGTHKMLTQLNHGANALDHIDHRWLELLRQTIQADLSQTALCPVDSTADTSFECSTVTNMAPSGTSDDDIDNIGEEEKGEDDLAGLSMWCSDIALRDNNGFAANTTPSLERADIGESDAEQGLAGDADADTVNADVDYDDEDAEHVHAGPIRDLPPKVQARVDKAFAQIAYQTHRRTNSLIFVPRVPELAGTC